MILDNNCTPRFYALKQEITVGRNTIIITSGPLPVRMCLMIWLRVSRSLNKILLINEISKTEQETISQK